VRVGIRASVVGTRRIESIESAAHSAATIVREACASGDHRALNRFWSSFVYELSAPVAANPAPPSADKLPRARRP